MKMDIIFQYKKDKDSRPDDITFYDWSNDFENTIPNVGDIVTMQWAPDKNNLSKKELMTCIVLSRHFFYSQKDYPNDCRFVWCTIYITLWPVNENYIGVDIKE